MKLWPITTKNKCFVKMWWHLLGGCVKVTILLVCSICIFFLIMDLYSFFLYIKVRMRVQCFCALYIYSVILLSHFVSLFIYLFKFWSVATVSSWFNQLCWAKFHYSTYNFFRLIFCIFFSLHTILNKNI